MGVVTLILLPFTLPQYSGETESIMLVNDHDIQIPLPQCLNNTCSHSCQYHLVRTKKKRENKNNFVTTFPPSPSLSLSQSCQLCYSCRSEDFTFTLKTAFLEHTNRRNFYRLVPPPLDGCHGNLLLTGGASSHVSLRINNYLMEEWFNGKCCQQFQWCS